jgi:hypothetical protein
MQPLTQDDKTFGMLAHLTALAGYIVPFGNILGPLVIWLMKKDQSWFVNDQGKESLNFQISLTIYVIVSMVLFLVVIGIFLLPLVALFGLVMIIIGGVKANQGETYRYPLTMRFIK